MEIRACTAEDLVLLEASWPTPGDTHAAHHAHQAAGQTTYLVAWRGDEPLGSGVLQWGGCRGAQARAAYPEAVELNHLQVRPHLQGHGVGSALLLAAEHLAQTAGRPQIAVGVATDNPDAKRLYLRLGYEPTGVFDVTEYTWVDADGAVHHEVERDELLLKELTSAPAR